MGRRGTRRKKAKKPQLGEEDFPMGEEGRSVEGRFCFHQQKKRV